MGGGAGAGAAMGRGDEEAVAADPEGGAGIGAPLPPVAAGVGLFPASEAARAATAARTACEGRAGAGDGRPCCCCCGGRWPEAFAFGGAGDADIVCVYISEESTGLVVRAMCDGLVWISTRGTCPSGCTRRVWTDGRTGRARWRRGWEISRCCGWNF